MNGYPALVVRLLLLGGILEPIYTDRQSNGASLCGMVLGDHRFAISFASARVVREEKRLLNAYKLKRGSKD